LPDLLDFALTGSGSIPSDVLDRARTSAQAVGYSQGWAQGVRDAQESMRGEVLAAAQDNAAFLQRAQAELQVALQSLAQVADRLDADAVSASHDLEDLVLATAVEIAEALIGSQLADTTSATRDALARILNLAPGREALVVRINSAVHAELAAHDFQGLLASVSATNGGSITFEADPTLAVGDAIARVGSSTIDARLSEGLRAIRAHLAATSQIHGLDHAGPQATR
jgi:flagellar assembly protein FliH